VKWQNREEVEEPMRKVKEAGAIPFLSEFSPIPGTVIWAAAKKASPYPIQSDLWKRSILGSS
jgi:hypothetical protein